MICDCGCPFLRYDPFPEKGQIGAECKKCGTRITHEHVYVDEAYYSYGNNLSRESMNRGGQATAQIKVRGKYNKMIRR